MALSLKRMLRHKGLIGCSANCCLFDRRPSRSRRDVVPTMPWSGLSPTSVKHAYGMGTSELHRTSIMLAATALTTNRSMYPKGLCRKPRKEGRHDEPKEPLWRIILLARNLLTEPAPIPRSRA